MSGSLCTHCVRLSTFSFHPLQPEYQPRRKIAKALLLHPGWLDRHVQSNLDTRQPKIVLWEKQRGFLELFKPLYMDCLQSEKRNYAVLFCKDWCYYSFTANKATASPVSRVPAEEEIPLAAMGGLVSLWSQPPGYCSPLAPRPGAKHPQSPQMAVCIRYKVCYNHSSFLLVIMSSYSSFVDLGANEREANEPLLPVEEDKGNAVLNYPMCSGKCCQKNKVHVCCNLRICLALVQEQDVDALCLQISCLSKIKPFTCVCCWFYLWQDSSLQNSCSYWVYWCLWFSVWMYNWVAGCLPISKCWMLTEDETTR